MTDIPDDIGPLRNQRHEMFCRGIAGGKNQSEAYRQAGYVGSNDVVGVAASNLAKKPDIQRRIKELVEAATPFVLTKDWLIGEMVDASRQALQDRAHSPRIRALELLGREKNAFTERKDIMVRSFDQYTTEEIEAFLASERAHGVAPRDGGSGARHPAKAAKRDIKPRRA